MTSARGGEGGGGEGSDHVDAVFERSFCETRLVGVEMKTRGRTDCRPRERQP
jgi:hypothetical protein